jgi:two-component system KDP operon response regulator KdpE
LQFQPHILVIDDDETILELVKETLSSDYQISAAHDSLEGVEMLLSERFDLLIIDLGMPVLDGVELIQKIRANSPFQNIPILVLSAYPELRTRIGSSDVQAIMAKPFSIDELSRTVADTISRSRRRAASPDAPPDAAST